MLKFRKVNKNSDHIINQCIYVTFDQHIIKFIVSRRATPVEENRKLDLTDVKSLHDLIQICSKV